MAATRTSPSLNLHGIKAMNIVQFFLIMVCVVGISIGQILFKLAAKSLPKSGGTLEIALSLILNPYLLIGLTVYLAATALWIWVLREVPLNLAYPLMALAFLFVPLLSMYLLGETFSRTSLFGGILIVSGVYIIVR